MPSLIQVMRYLTGPLCLLGMLLGGSVMAASPVNTKAPVPATNGKAAAQPAPAVPDLPGIKLPEKPSFDPPDGAKRLAKIMSISSRMTIRDFFQGPGSLVGVVLDPIKGTEPATTFDKPKLPEGVTQTAKGVTQNGKSPIPSGMIIFVDPSGRYMVAGMIIDMSNGSNLMAELSQKYFPKDNNPISMAEAVEGMKELAQVPAPGEPLSAKAKRKKNLTEAKVASLPLIHDGPAKAKHIVYAFIDPNCSHCQQAVREAAKMKEADPDLAIRWILIGLGGNPSVIAAGSIMGSKDRLHAMVEYMKDDKAIEKLRLKLADPAFKKLVATGVFQVEKSMEYADMLGVDSTPLFIAFKKGEEPRTLIGYPGSTQVNGLFKK